MLATRLRGARIHNLRGVDLDLRPGEVVVLTGVSGAGKSSLGLDTLYAEGQRRFVESFSPYARQFLERLERPPMDALEPVGAGVAVDRSAPVKSSRSTVATMADLEPYLAGLFAKESVAHCPEHGLPAVELDVRGALERVLALRAGQRILVTVSRAVASREDYLALVEELAREGYRRVVCGGEVYEIDGLKPSLAAKAGVVHVVLDRLAAERGSAGRLAEALEAAFARSAEVLVFGDGEPTKLRLGSSCPDCMRPLAPPRPGYFSYESPLGACGNCRGFGRILGIDWAKVIPDDRLSLKAGALRPWRGDSAAWERKQLALFCQDNDIPFDVPWSQLDENQRRAVLQGGPRRGKKKSDYPGVAPWFAWLETKTYKMHVRVFLARFRSYDPCPVCAGARLNELALTYRLGGLDLAAWHRLEVGELLERLEQLAPATPHGQLLVRELSTRLSYLSRVGLGYLSLDRQARTLSGGEAQRVTLTAALGTSLHNAMFVLDEPTVGLHPSDIGPLCDLIAELSARGNTVLVIEHEPLVIERADRVIELGPASGERGGTIVFDGDVPAALRFSGATARALQAPAWSEVPARPASGRIELRGVTEHNLANVDVDVPLGQLVMVSGPSGSGKSSLVVDVLYRAVARQLGVADVEAPGRHASARGIERIESVELVDQSPLGRTSRGNPATYTKAWDAVRKAFAAEPEAERLGFGPSHFSFNVAGGRCEACSGEGYETVEMQFLADVSLVCPVCSGRRFKDEVLAVKHRGRTIADMLELTVAEALELFADSAAIRRALAPLASLGLAYVRLGQPLSTLSGGEAQRLKLARALASPGKSALYVLDEPSAGLHADEIAWLVQALRVLVRAGGSVVCVDHDLGLLMAADAVVELGPGGGSKGGRLVFSGSPRALAREQTSTGRALASWLGRGATVARPSLPQEARPAILSVRGAREHTLADVSVDIPHGQLTVVTGPSGSGKSTLAFDVVFAEGQRRFLETLTPYARRFLPTLPRPNVDSVTGVPPSIALEQRTTRIGARSTVATVTEVAHYLRLAYAKLGVPHCPTHDRPIGRISEKELLSLARTMPGSGELRAPVVRGRKGTYLDVFSSAARGGIAWAVADGKRVGTDTPPRLAKTKEHDLDLVIAEELTFAQLEPAVLAEALRWGRGNAVLWSPGEERTISLGGACPDCGFAVGDVDPRWFSFNTAQGQCPACEGTGRVPEEKTRGKKTTSEPRPLCKECGGSRLAPFPRRVRLLDVTYPELTRLSVLELRQAVAGWKFPKQLAPIARPIVAELERRLVFLGEVGLDYLALDRDAGTLSGGELQRLRLAAQLGAGLTGALYVLDEPTIGLHPRDTGRLLGNLRRLVETGSTVLLVEHDEDAILAADHVIDLGPAGGSGGGHVQASGSPHAVLESADSPTGRALRNRRLGRTPRPLPSAQQFLELRGATMHNLAGVDAKFPVGRLSVVAGVSGSGKSSLVRGVLLPALRRKLERVGAAPGHHEALLGYDAIRRALAVDQSPIGRTPRSVPATFLGIFDELRQLFARSTEARTRGFTATRFSFNSAGGGRCPTCEGQGVLSHEMSFLPDVVTPCPACGGLRFEERTLDVRYLGLNIGEVLQLSAEDAARVFAAHPRIIRPLQVLHDLGAGYITLGQGSHTLSGGEAQRLKLAAELSAGSRHEPTLYVLDEPTTGLHLADVERLLGVLDRLVERGDTLVVIEHHPDVIRTADWLVELGPEGGPQGGKLVAQGTVRELAKRKTATGRVLAASR
ncbi:MAG TPA: excinuclease ABC subunit UvrA [Polyangiaceae bacterium]|nr:excinuclease ABC subunit UvrA [Polyangiaceae bacterium]